MMKIAFLFLFLWGCAFPPQGADGQPKPSARDLRLGMSPAAVRAILGPPRRVARQLLYQRYLEQWHFDQPEVAWVEFDQRRGQEPRLQTVQTPKPALP